MGDELIPLLLYSININYKDMVNKLHTKVVLSGDKKTYEVWTSTNRITWKMVRWGLTFEEMMVEQDKIINQNYLNLLNDILKG